MDGDVGWKNNIRKRWTRWSIWLLQWWWDERFFFFFLTVKEKENLRGGLGKLWKTNNDE